MKNLKFFASFNGARYHGFQRQVNAVTVQAAIETALKKILNENIVITGCSRTDAGVHAKSFCFNAHTSKKIPCDNLVKALNSVLPSDIAVFSCEQVDEKFNARFDALGKEYVYLINNKKERDVFLQGLSYHYPYKLDENELNEISQLFVGEKDFAAFCRSEGKKETKSTIRRINSFEVKRNDGFVEFVVSGNGFLYNMVRILAGTLIYFSEGKRNRNDVEEAFLTGDREKAGKTLPPCGLYLNKVFYD